MSNNPYRREFTPASIPINQLKAPPRPSRSDHSSPSTSNPPFVNTSKAAASAPNRASPPSPYSDSSENSKSIANQRQVELVLSEIRSVWPFFTEEHFQEVPVALNLLENPGNRSVKSFEEILTKLEAALDIIVNDFHASLNFSVQFYTETTDELSDSQERLLTIKNLLSESRDCLQLKQFDLLGLWNKSNHYNEMIRILNLIDDLQQAPSKIESMLFRKNYFGAVKRLLAAIDLANGKECAPLGALDDIRKTLSLIKDKIFESIINDVGDHIYLKSPFSEDRWINFYRFYAPNANLSLSSPTSAANKKTNSVTSRRMDTILLPSLSKPIGASESMEPESMYFEEQQEHQEESLEIDSLHFITLCLEALMFLGQLVEGLSQLKQRLPTELFQLVERNVIEFKEKAGVPQPSYFHLADTHVLRDNHAKESKFLVLSDHFLTLFAKLESAMECHKLICNLVEVMARRESFQKYNNDSTAFPVYAISDVWMAIQRELQRFIMNHLATKGTSSDFMVIDLFKESTPVTHLFKFNQSSTYSSILSFYQSQIQSSLPPSVNHVLDPYAADKSMDHTTLCPPDIEFISTLYTPTMEFFHRMASFSSLMSPAESCEFLDEFILSTYIPSVESKVQTHVHKYINGPDGFILSDNNLLQSATCLLSLIKSLCATIKNVPFHRQEYIRMIQDVLNRYAEKCQSKYQSAIINTIEQQTVTTVAGIWAQNQDLANILTKNTHFRCEPLDKKLNERSNSQEIVMESKLRSDRSFQKSELLFHKKKLELLASLRVSLKWFKNEVQQLMETKVDNTLEIMDLSSLSDPYQSQENLSPLDTPTYSPTAISMGEDPLLMVAANQRQSIGEILKSYEWLSDLCLITLHIEIRTHSMYFLDLAMREGNYFFFEESVDPEPYILQLNNDLILFEEIVSKSLPKNEAQFVFDGLPLLFKHYFISNAHYIRRLNEQGALKMIKSIRALHQNLLNLDLCEEIQLDHARKYYELFLEGVESILTKVTDHEPMYAFSEYKTMIHFMLDIPSLPDLIRSEDVTTSATAEKNMAYYHAVVKKLSSIMEAD